MATVAEPVVIPKPRESRAARILRVTAKAPVNLVLLAIGLLWLVPTVGLLLTSILPAAASAEKGWWQIFTKPSLATWSNYNALFHNSGLLTALKTLARFTVAEAAQFHDEPMASQHRNGVLFDWMSERSASLS